jgi:hypothetical protein
MNLVELPKIDLGDIPARMENMAAEIRGGQQGNIEVAAAVFIRDDGDIVVCGWGRDADDVRAVGILHLGAAWLAAHITKR